MAAIAFQSISKAYPSPKGPQGTTFLLETSNSATLTAIASIVYTPSTRSASIFRSFRKCQCINLLFSQKLGKC